MASWRRGCARRPKAFGLVRFAERVAAEGHSLQGFSNLEVVGTERRLQNVERAPVEGLRVFVTSGVAQNNSHPEQRPRHVRMAYAYRLIQDAAPPAKQLPSTFDLARGRSHATKRGQQRPQLLVIGSSEALHQREALFPYLPGAGRIRVTTHLEQLAEDLGTGLVTGAGSLSLRQGLAEPKLGSLVFARAFRESGSIEQDSPPTV